MSSPAATVRAPMSKEEPPRWLWLWFPPLLLILELGVRAYSGAAYTRWFDNELGVVELATPLCSALGVVAGIAALRHRHRLPTGLLQGWVALVTLACVYLAGEELSWGQHLFGWSTPESLMAANDQGETNLHNVSSWFDQKPRLLLELFVLYGGIIHVLLQRGDVPCDHIGWGDWRIWFWPTYICLPSALLAILVRMPDRLEDWFGIGPLPFAIRWSEAQEYYFALFLCLYLLSIAYRVRRTD
jgi:hypothetical protein